ncbi:MAG TPA: hypothetical protein VFQ89_07060 [Candidatus Binatia bacterium]|nr:hypothetical protein [Candidatus Binatia bacterium]
MKHNSWRLFMFVIGLCVAWAPQGFGAEKPFYEGKTLTVLIDYAAGDAAAARLASVHFTG